MVEGVRNLVSVPEDSAQGECLMVVAEGLMVLASAVGDEPEAVQGGRLTCGVVVVSVQGKGCAAVATGGVELAQTRRIPADQVERIGFPHRSVEGAVEGQSVLGVLQRPSVISLSSPSEREYSVGVCLFGGVMVVHGQREGLVEMPGGLLVQAQPRTGVAGLRRMRVWVAVSGRWAAAFNAARHASTA